MLLLVLTTLHVNLMQWFPLTGQQLGIKKYSINSGVDSNGGNSKCKIHGLFFETIVILEGGTSDECRYTQRDHCTVI